jgi:hypothetical protein
MAATPEKSLQATAMAVPELCVIEVASSNGSLGDSL